METITKIVIFCQLIVCCLSFASANTLDSKTLFLESHNQKLTDEDQILEVVDLSCFADVGVPNSGWYEQIIRIKMDLGFRPAMVEFTKNNRVFELFVKYTDGEKIAYNDSYFFASKDIKKYHFKFDTTNVLYENVAEVFKKFNFYSITPINISMSAFRQDVEFFSHYPQHTYVKCTIWGKPAQKFLVEGIQAINSIVNSRLEKDKNHKSKVFERWNNEITKWNQK